MYLLKLFPSFLLFAQPFVSATPIASNSKRNLEAFRVRLPPVTGPHGVGRVRFDLTDESRIDPFAVNPKTPRTIVLNVFYPAEPEEAVEYYHHGPYLPPKLANSVESAYGLPNGTIGFIQPNSYDKAKILKGVEKNHRNVIIFSAGLGAPPLGYQTYHEELASWGYVVVAIDHPYDDAVVEIPSTGEVILGKINNETEQVLLPALAVRVGDVKFTLNSLSKADIMQKYIPNLSDGFNVDSGVIMYGHSFGGSAAANAIKKDKRIIGGFNLDGAIQGNVVNTGFRRPFVLMGRGSHNLTSGDSWTKIWPKLKGFKLALSLKGAEHLTFTDLPIIADRLGLSKHLQSDDLKKVIGTIDAEEALKTVRAYLKGFADMVLKKKKVAIMYGPSKDYPSVVYNGKSRGTHV